MSATAPGREITLTEAFERAETATDDAQTDATPEAEAEGTDCHHDDVWAESGVCMACSPAVGAADAVARRQQLGDDAGGGRL